MRTRLITLMLTLIGLLMSINPVFADLMTTSDVEKLATNFLQEHTNLDPDETLKVRLANIQPSIKVPTCETGINISYPENTNQSHVSTLELTCKDTANWKIYLPVEVSTLKTVIVAKETIFPRDQITSKKLTYALYDKKKLYRGYFSDPSELEGLVASRIITAGAVLNKKNIKEKIVIKRNQNVEIVSRKGFIQIKARGIARTDGALNDTIKVYNPSSKRVIDATVINSGVVEVA